MVAALLVFVLLLGAACAAGGGEQATPGGQRARSTTTAAVSPAPSTATAAVSTSTTPPTTAATMAEPPPTTAAVAPVPPRPATASCPPTRARRTPDAQRPRYRMDVTADLAADVVRGDITVRFTPDLSTDRLVFRLWPNAPRPAQAGARLTMTGPFLARDGAVLHSEQPEPTTVVAYPPQPLAAGQSIDLRYSFSLGLPGQVNDRLSRTGDAVRLGSFFPVLAWEPGIGWAQEPATAGFAEAATMPAADFDVGIQLPPGIGVLATGMAGPDGRWTVGGVRDFAMSLGRFRTVEGTAAGGVRVVVGVHEGVRADPNLFLGRVTAALDDMAERFGPYPWPSYTLAITPALGGGIEFPAHVMQGPDTSGRTTSHEVAHMWFYALVGNNQGRDPVLDEGLATWAEARFEGTLGSMRARSIPADARGRAGAPMTYWEPRLSSYYRGVYVQGAQALAALGDPAVVDCALRHYVAAHSYGIARQPDLVAAMGAHFPDAASVLARYGIG